MSALCVERSRSLKSKEINTYFIHASFSPIKLQELMSLQKERREARVVFYVEDARKHRSKVIKSHFLKSALFSTMYQKAFRLEYYG